MKCWKFLFAFLVLTLPMIAADKPKIVPMSVTLKPRQPNWRLDLVEAFPNGQPKQIVFYEPSAKGGELPVKQTFYHEQGGIQSEADIVTIDEKEPGYAIWKSTLVPHGYKIDFSSKGEVFKVTHFNRGQLDGECRTLYPNGSNQSVAHYVQNQPEGLVELYYEDGQKKEEAQYVHGQLNGDCIQYHPNGTRSALIPHVDGKIHGLAMEWYEDGVLKSQRQFVKGQLHGNGKNPAMITYDEKRNLVEVCDFRQGEPIGLRICYHKNGKESYHVNFKDGKKEGQEQFFHDDGTLLGEGSFVAGTPVGNHWRKHPNGQIALTAHFDSAGNGLEPLMEYSDNGTCVRKYTVQKGLRQGPMTEWYSDGVVKGEYQFVDDQHDGEQKEFYPSGQIKVCSHFKKGLRDGIQEEWHENGILAGRMHFADNLKEGQAAVWFQNGVCRSEGYYHANLPDGVISEWHENGQLKKRSEFAAGEKEHWHREWDEAGNLISEFYFEHNQPHGTALTWWNKDQIRSRFHFEHGEKEGLQEWFYENGHPERIAMFAHNLMEGEWKMFFNDGSLRSIQHFHANLPTAEFCEYFAKDKPNQKDEERLAHVIHYDDQGRLHGEERIYYPDHTLQSVIVYDQGHPHGLKQVFDAKGCLVEEAHYVQGKLEDRYFQKLGDGRETVFHYKNNLKEGVHQVTFPPNEKGQKVIAVEASFVNG